MSSDTQSNGVAGHVMDIPVAVSVELGRTEIPVREIVNLSPGTVIELDKGSEDPVDIYVNGCLIARGEVVVVDDAIGIKLTEVIQNNSG